MAMIQTTLELIRRELNQRLLVGDPRSEDWVILSNIVGLNGEPFPEAQNKVVMCLANIQHETIISTYQRGAPVAGGDRIGVVPPPLYIDLFVLFYANFGDGNYRQGLDMISQTIAFFQQNVWFTRENLPGLDGRIDKLSFEFTNLDLAELHCLMGNMGAKYLPSVYYKVRMIPFNDGNG
ncbi:MAG: DUF4255 domain-containing protein [Terracidiphilus sp.]|jgi:hypothetical protein